MDFDTFFANSWSEMLARAVVLSGSRQDAEDAVQEAYAAALSGWDRISTYDNPGAWVYKIVRQRLWKSARRWRKVSVLSPEDLTSWRATEGDPERFTEATMALTALKELPHRQRMVMIMHCLHQMDQKEIADELGLTRGSVAASIHKARRKLEKALGLKDTELTAVERPGTALTRVDAQPVRDPIETFLSGAVSALHRNFGSAAGAKWLATVHRKARPEE